MSVEPEVGDSNSNADDRSPFETRGQREPQTRARQRQSVERMMQNAGIATRRADRVSDLSVAAIQDSIARLDRLLDDLRDIGPEIFVSAPERGYDDVPAPEAARLMRTYRRVLLQRLVYLQRHDQMEEIKEAVEEKVLDPAIRRELSELVERISQQQIELVSKIQAQDDWDAVELKRLNMMKQRWEVRKAMLEREPAAVLVGAVLLILLALSLIIAMFMHTDVPEIVASGFLLILGFFFGQNSSRGGSSGDAN